MKKIGLLKNEKMGEYEKEKGFASYKTIIERFVGDIVLCNNIAEIDSSIWDNMNICEDIYQYYLCNISDYEKEILTSAGVIISYSDMLECDVLCVDHFGTSWDYVLTSVKLFDTYEELEAYEESEE